MNNKLICNILYFGDNLRGVTGVVREEDRVSFPSNPGLFKTTLPVHTERGPSRSDDLTTVFNLSYFLLAFSKYLFAKIHSFDTTTEKTALL